MGDGTEQNPYTREDVVKAIEENRGTGKRLNLFEKYFEEGIILSEEYDGKGINLAGAAFNKSVLKGAVFDKCHLEEIRLMGANLEGAWFEEAHLEGSNLSGAYMKNTHFVSAHLEKATLNSTHFEGAEFFDAHLEGAKLVNAFLDRARLSGAHLQGAHMQSAKFTASTEMHSVDWGDYILGEEKEGEKKDQVHFLRWAEEIYRKLKLWYIEHGIYDVAGEFLFREMEAKRKNLSWWQPKKRRWLGWWPLRGQKVRLNAYKWLCGYGERPWRVVAWGLLVLVGLALIYFLLRGVAPYSLTLEALLGSLYYSAVSFTALGYGPWFGASSVRGWAQGVGAAEAVLGVFMIALFLVTFVRKMTR